MAKPAICSPEGKGPKTLSSNNFPCLPTIFQVKTHFPLPFLRWPWYMVLRVSLPTQLRCGQFQSKRSCPSKESRRKELHFLPVRRERVQGTSWNGTSQDSSTNGRYSAVTKGNHHRSGGTGSSSRHKLSESRRYFAENFEGNELPRDGRPSCLYALSLSLSLSLYLSIYPSIYLFFSPFFSRFSFSLLLNATLRILVHESDFSGVTDPFNLVEAFSITDTLLNTF